MAQLRGQAHFWRCHATADDFGAFPADPIICKNIAAPRRELTTDQVKGWLDELARAHLIRYCQHEGELYASIVGFIELQPANRNGRRIRRYPKLPYEDCEPGVNESKGGEGDPVESGGIQGTSSQSCASDTETDADTEKTGDGGNVEHALEEAGVRAPGVIEEIVGMSDVTAAKVRRCVAKARSKRRKNRTEVAGLVVKLIRERDWNLPPPCSAREAVAAFKRGEWSSVNRVDCAGKMVKFNAEGLVVDGSLLVPTSEISKATFE